MKPFWMIHLFLMCTALILSALPSEAARLKDIAKVRGVRQNQLVGYGVVVGLKGSGDSKSEFTNKSVARMLDKLGVKISSADLSSKNVAAVVITADLPPFARAGNEIDVTINSIGDATSLEGGTLVQSPLRAANKEVYAVAQGSLLVGGKTDHKTVARIPSGAIIERDFAADYSSRKMFRITLNNPDFTTSARVAKIVNLDLSGKYATAKDAATIDIIVPPSYEGRGVEFLANVENLEVNPDQKAKVVVNERTGTVIIGDGVRVSRVAISHGDLSVKVNGGKDENPAQERVGVIRGTSVGELVKALNALGVSPKDLITILENIKAAGALQGELEIL